MLVLIGGTRQIENLNPLRKKRKSVSAVNLKRLYLILSLSNIMGSTQLCGTESRWITIQRAQRPPFRLTNPNLILSLVKDFIFCCANPTHTPLQSNTRILQLLLCPYSYYILYLFPVLSFFCLTGPSLIF